MPEGEDILDKKNGWYVSRGGETFGPVDFDTVIEAAKAGRLEPRTDMLYGGDLTEWVPAGEVPGVFERVDPNAVDEEGSENSVDDGLAEVGEFDEDEGAPTKLDLPGAHRLGYFFGITLLPAVLIIGLAKMMPIMIEVVGSKYGGYVPYVFLLVPVLILIVTIKRFQNLAMSGWWWFGLMVPILQLWLHYRLFACPPGYAFTKKLDVAGKILAVIYWLAMVGSIAVSVMFGAVLAKKGGEEDFQGQMQEIRNQIDSWALQAKQNKDKAERE